MTKSMPTSRTGVRFERKRVESTQGVVELVHLAHGVLGSRMVGHLDLALTRETLAYTDRVLERDGASQMFHDWADMTGYDGEARAMCTDYARGRFRLIRGVHLLVRSPIVSMGIATANLVTSQAGVSLVAHRDRAAFEAARDAAISGAA